MNNVFFVDAFSGMSGDVPPQQFGLRGRWTNTRIFQNREHYNDFSKWGRAHVKPMWEVEETPNGITNEGIQYNLNTAFTNGDTAETAWYAGLIDSAGYTGVDATDTMASHTGWAESTDYSESVRQTLSFATISGTTRAITAAVSFTMNATKTINGLFVVTVNTKGGSTGVLWSTALYTTAPSLESGNVLTSNYTLSD